GDDLAQIRRYCKCAEELLVIGRDHGIYRGRLPCSARCDEYQRNESSEGEPSHSFFHSVVSSLRDTGPAPVAQLKRQVPPGQATSTIFHESDEWKPGPRASDRTRKLRGWQRRWQHEPALAQRTRVDRPETTKPAVRLLISSRVMPIPTRHGSCATASVGAG